jgi:hypothetical protein
MRSLLIAFALAFAACSSPSPQKLANKPPPTSSSADPRAFALQLIDILERDDLEAWRDLLSTRMQRRMDDDDELRRQLNVWRHELVPRAHELRAANYSLDRTGPQHFVIYQSEGKHPEALAKVVEERGALRLDEN